MIMPVVNVGKMFVRMFDFIMCMHVGMGSVRRQFILLMPVFMMHVVMPVGVFMD